jgi:hypothetical protein
MDEDVEAALMRAGSQIDALQADQCRLSLALREAVELAEHHERQWISRGELLAEARRCMLQLMAFEADLYDCEAVAAKLNDALAFEDADANNQAARAA